MAFGGEFRQVGDTLQLTNVLILCLSPQFGQCGAIDVSFEAHNGIGPVGLLAIDLSLAGALDSASGFGRVCIAQGSIICPANLDGPQSTTLSFVNGVVQPSTAIGVNIIDAPFTLKGVFHLDALVQPNFRSCDEFWQAKG